MIQWLTTNAPTIVVSAILALIVGLVICKMIKDKKAGKKSCGCGCSCETCGLCVNKDLKK